MKKRIALCVENMYEDLEFWYPKYRMLEAGIEVNVIGPKAEVYVSKHGYPAEADLAVAQAEAKDFDAVIIPGGYAPDHMRRCEDMVDFVQQAATQGKIVAAICHAGWMLASANIIRDKNVTGFSSIKDDLINAGGKYLDQAVVRDGNIITSRKPDDLPAFCREILKALKHQSHQDSGQASFSAYDEPLDAVFSQSSAPD